MNTPHPNQLKPAPELELDALMAELDKDFGKKSKKKSDNDIARERNKAFHQENPKLDPATGKAPELDMSGNWRSTARVVYIIRQHCATCNNTVEFIGGEFVVFESKRQHSKIWRRAEHCPSHWFWDENDEPLEDLIDEFDQTVSRCPGCIAVERKAFEIWETATKNGTQSVIPVVTEKDKQEISGKQLQAIIKRDFGARVPKIKPELKVEGID